MNIPYTSQQVKDLPKGMNITKSFLHLNKTTGEISYYPNRSQRRNMMFKKSELSINNKKPSNARQVILQKIPVFINETNKIITKLMKAGKDYLEIIFAGFKNIFHQKMRK